MSEVEKLGKDKLKQDITYLLCPDKSCELYGDASSLPTCEHDCPKEDELVKIIFCKRCHNIIELPGNHSYARRVICDPGCGTMNLHRLSGKYQIIYEKPE
jgi:hypothetical protein|tara:strand:+ start:2366 stop:2665 length:300 start_codon:yes stop_codon:yes gene_type:complete